MGTVFSIPTMRPGAAHRRFADTQVGHVETCHTLLETSRLASDRSRIDPDRRTTLGGVSTDGYAPEDRLLETA
jgi:hypothetical protein